MQVIMGLFLLAIINSSQADDYSGSIRVRLELSELKCVGYRSGQLRFTFKNGPMMIGHIRTPYIKKDFATEEDCFFAQYEIYRQLKGENDLSYESSFYKEKSSEAYCRRSNRLGDCMAWGSKEVVYDVKEVRIFLGNYELKYKEMDRLDVVTYI